MQTSARVGGGPGRSLLAGVLVLLSLGAAAAQAQPETRAVWVTRYDYRSAADVARIFSDVASLGANRVLFQVRGNGSVFYPSAHEPWSARLGGADPGWDPLATAVAAAEREGLALEAWINALPLWKGLNPPTDPAHPYLRHPEWVVVGSDGRPQQRNPHYVCANPARADVRAHVAAVAAEIAANYPVDAVHLDYIRYVLDLERELDFSHDPESLRRFAGDPTEDPAGWARFKAAQVTAVVRAVREALRAARPGCRLTAAVYGVRAGRARVFQDVEAWVREGLLDAVYPMTYAADSEEFARRLRESLPLGERANAPPLPVFPGVAVRRHPDPAETRRQLTAVRAAGAPGFALFCYSALFPSVDRDELASPAAELRAGRVALLRELLR